MVKFLKTCDIKKNWVMCYPYGSYNKDTVSILSKEKIYNEFLGIFRQIIFDKKKSF